MHSEQEFSYLAGIIDGEGTVTIHRHMQHNRPTFQYKPLVIVSNTDRQLLIWLQEKFGGTFTKKRDSKDGHKELFLWRVMSIDGVKYILERCLPYMIIKKERAILVLKYISERESNKKHNKYYSSYGTVEQEIYARVRALNQRSFVNADDESLDTDDTLQ